MSELLGWVRSMERQKNVAGCVLVSEGPACGVYSEMAPPEKRQRLRLVQACFRRFDGFLPHVSGIEARDADRLLEQIERLSCFGQLRIRLRRAAPAGLSLATSGRMHLRSLRARRSEAKSWYDEAEAVLLGFVRRLDVHDSIMLRGDDALVADLLLPKFSEPHLPSLMQKTRADPCWTGLGELAVSGLWAPMTFTNWQGTKNG